MAIPSLPTEVIGLILAQANQRSLLRCARVHKSWLPFCQPLIYRALDISRRRDFLGDQHRTPPLLATLISHPALAAHVRMLHFDGWNRNRSALEAPDEVYLAQLLGCCTGPRRLELRGAYLWIDDLVLIPRLVSLTFADGTRLRSRHKNPELLALPPINHLGAGAWDTPSSNHRRGSDALDFDDLGPASMSLFSSLTYLDLENHGPQTTEQLSEIMHRILPHLQSLSFYNDAGLNWQPLLPLCTSLKQLSCHIFPRNFDATYLLDHGPPSLAFLHLGADSPPYSPSERRAFLEAIARSVRGLTGLRALQLDFEHPSHSIYELEPLLEVCSKRGVAVRIGRIGAKSLGEQWVGPRRGEKEVKWTKVWSQVPL